MDRKPVPVEALERSDRGAWCHTWSGFESVGVFRGKIHHLCAADEQACLYLYNLG